MSHHIYWVYILCSDRNGTLYIGVTNDLSRRIFEHKNKVASKFTQKYHVDKLVYCEDFSDINDAIAREKMLKRWNRKWKLRLIEEVKPEWRDLYEFL
jgi:putative endonuclease